MIRFIEITKLLRYLMILLLTFALVASTRAAPQINPGINKVYINKISDNDFIVSWTTDFSSDGTAYYGESIPPDNSISDNITNTTTHYIKIDELKAETKYFISVSSGTEKDDNGGLYYEVTTGPILGIPAGGGLIYGQLFESNGTTPAPNAIVYIQLQDANGTGNGNSQWVTARTDSDGFWSFNLPRIRNDELNSYFDYTTGEDNLYLVFHCGENGEEIIVPIPTDDPGYIGSLTCVKNTSYTYLPFVIH
jgi:hypothetical protein